MGRKQHALILDDALEVVERSRKAPHDHFGNALYYIPRKIHNEQQYMRRSMKFFCNKLLT